MKELLFIQHELKAPKGKYNSFGKYRYRSAEDILEALKPILHDLNCYLVISDDLVVIGERYYIKSTATLTNSAGDSISSNGFAREEDEKKGQDASQITGSASSYARKYALNGLFLIDDGIDADSLTTSAVDYRKQLEDCKSIAELQSVWKSIPVKTPYQKVKDEMKIKLSEK